MSRELDPNHAAGGHGSGNGIVPPDWMTGFEEGIGRKAKPLAAIFVKSARSGEADIARQIRVCTDYVGRIGARLVEVNSCFVEKTRSGTNRTGKEGLEDLLACAAAGMFDMVVVEDVDRLSRNLGDLTKIHRVLVGSGVKVHAASCGRLDLTHLAVSGFLQAEQCRRMADRVRLGRVTAKSKRG